MSQPSIEAASAPSDTSQTPTSCQLRLTWTWKEQARRPRSPVELVSLLLRGDASATRTSSTSISELPSVLILLPRSARAALPFFAGALEVVALAFGAALALGAARLGDACEARQGSAEAHLGCIARQYAYLLSFGTRGLKVGARLAVNGALSTHPNAVNK